MTDEEKQAMCDTIAVLDALFSPPASKNAALWSGLGSMWDRRTLGQAKEAVRAATVATSGA